MTFNFMKRTRKQTAFASLSDQEKELLADWLRKEDYDDVHNRVNKSPSDGGFGLSISLKPLRTFHAKVALLDIINSRLPEHKRMTIAQFESIAAGEILLARSFAETPDPGNQASGSSSEPQSAIENRQSAITDEAHQAILEATRDLALHGDNSPTDLLALQRLADFPARSEYREHKRQLELRHEQRAIERQGHKIHTDAERAADKKDMNDHRKHINEERLALSRQAHELRKRSFELREKQLAARGSARVPRADSGVPPESSSKFHLWTAEEVEHNQAKIEAAIQADPLLRHIGLPCETSIPTA